VRGTRPCTVGAIRTDHRDQRDHARIREQPRDLGDPSDVLRPVLSAETEIAVQPVPEIVAVEHVRGTAAVEQP
jgi:hypothetical protein